MVSVLENPNLINTSSLWGLFESFVIISLLIYVFFAILVIRQIYLMNKALITGIASYIKLIGWLHLFFALLVLVVSISVVL